MKNRIGSAISVILLLTMLSAVPCFAGTPVGLGQVTNVQLETGYGAPGTCPSGWGFGAASVTCYTAAVNACPNYLPTISLTFGYAYTGGGTPLGTIVFFSGDGGTVPQTAPGQEYNYGIYYLQHNYLVVELAWANTGGWQYAGAPPGYTSTTPLLDSACRPASFLNFVYNSTAANHASPVLYYPSSGMCAQGDSGGSSAVAYSMAWYGVGSGLSGYPALDKVELLSGPVESDISAGCKTPQNQTRNVCAGNNPPCYGYSSPAHRQRGIYGRLRAGEDRHGHGHARRKLRRIQQRELFVGVAEPEHCAELDASAELSQHNDVHMVVS